MALHDAAFKDDLQELTLLLTQGALVNASQATNYSSACSTALHVASEHASLSVVKQLLQKGADVLAQDAWGHTPAHLAALDGNSDLLQALLDSNPRVLDVLDEQDRTPLHAAAHVGSSSCVQLLLASGAKVVRLHIDVEDHTVPVGSAVHTAAAEGHAECLAMLVAAADDDAINGGDVFDRSPLHLAAAKGHTECIQILLAAGAKIHARTSCGASALHLASRSQAPLAITTLLSAGADVNGRDRYGMAPLHHSARAGCAESMKLLVDAKAELDCCSVVGETALSIAAVAGAAASLAVLLPAGASLACISPCWDQLDASTREAFHEHVRQVALTSGATFAAFSKLQGCRAGALCSDAVHRILQALLGVSEPFLRLLLDGSAEER